MAAAGAILADSLDALTDAVAPGVTGRDLDRLARDLIAESGARPSFLGYRGFRGAVCVSPNDLVVHGIPGDQPLEDGDLVSVDLGVTLDGWVVDAARTVAVSTPSREDAHLIGATEAALDDAVDACVVGGHLGDIGAAVEARAQLSGLEVFPTLIGHGVGRALHEDPQVPNVGTRGRGLPLAEGMVLAVEPMLTSGAPHVRLSADGWSVFTVDGARAAHAEVSVAITADGPRVLTPWGGRW